MRRAAALRERLALDADAFRLVHAEGDGLPGLVIDRYGDVAVMEPYEAAWEPYLPAIASLLADEQGVSAVLVRPAWGTARPVRVLRGHMPEVPLVIREGRLRFAVDVEAGQKTGFFLDQRENRRRLAGLAGGARVLNLFSYSGGFCGRRARRGRPPRPQRRRLAGGALARAPGLRAERPGGPRARFHCRRRVPRLAGPRRRRRALRGRRGGPARVREEKGRPRGRAARLQGHQPAGYAPDLAGRSAAHLLLLRPGGRAAFRPEPVRRRAGRPPHPHGCWSAGAPGRTIRSRCSVRRRRT